MKYFFMILFSTQMMAFDHTHSKLDQVLKNYVQTGPVSSLFQYKKLSENSDIFISYLNDLERLKEKEFETFNKNQKLAFWINAYNAYTIQLIIKNYPVSSIKNIKPKGLFSVFSSPWKIQFIHLLGKELSLDNIEHDIIRKEFDEPRIHFAVNCASIGCPSLRNESFVDTKLDSQLEDSAFKFVTNTKKNKIDNSRKKLSLSQIFKWYGGDFDNKYGSYLKFFSQIHPEKLDYSGYEVSWENYDWDLNE